MKAQEAEVLEVTEVEKIGTKFGIEKAKANEFLGNLPQIKAEREAFEAQYAEIITLSLDDKETPKKAHDLRMLIVKNRTQGIGIWHKNTKEVYLRAGQFIDAVKNLEIGVNERMEAKLEEIEKYAEKQEQIRKDKLRSDRLALLEGLCQNPNIYLLSEMADTSFDELFNALKQANEAKLEREAKEREAEIERQRIEEQAEIERQRINDLTNARFPIMAPLTKYLLSGEEMPEQISSLSEEEFSALISKLKGREEAHEAEQAKIKSDNLRLQKEKEEQDAIIQAQMDANQKLQREIQAKRDEELKAQEEQSKAENAAKLAPDKDKILAFAQSIKNVTFPEIAHSDAKQIAHAVMEKQNGFYEWIVKQANLL